jgi:N-hydroxyarylamine O-acetyltransferase
MIHLSKKDEFPIGKYRELLGIPNIIKLTPNIETLFLIVNKHVLNVDYCNIQLHMKNFKPEDMSGQSLPDRIIYQHYGYCYDLAELLFYALKHIGFEVSRYHSDVLKGNPYDPEQINNHDILIAEIDDKSFLIDVGLGDLSSRYPVEFSFQEDEEKFLNPFEIYKLELKQDHFLYSMKVEGKWLTLFRFARPLQAMDQETFEKKHNELCFSTKKVLIRDTHLQVAKLYETGRVYVWYQPGKEIFCAEKTHIERGMVSKRSYQDYQEMKEDIEEVFGIKLPPLLDFKQKPQVPQSN